MTKDSKIVINKEINDFEEYLEREVQSHGNSGRIQVPKKYIKRKAIIIIQKEGK